MYWNSIKVLETLNVDTHTKYIALLVNLKSEHYPEGVDSILIAHKQPFDNASNLVSFLHGTLFSPTPSPTGPGDATASLASIILLENNDVYWQFLFFIGEYAAVKLSVIHPATSTHIAKYRRQGRLFVSESPHLYQTITQPYIKTQGGLRIKWIDNILSGVSEQDKIIWNDPDLSHGFLILPDSKWDQKTMNALYLLVLVRRRDILSLRDLRPCHLPLLTAIRRAIDEFIPRRFGFPSNSVRVYIHYMPTYFYFHLHIVHVEMETMGAAAGVAHLLDDVIDNIANIRGDYYAIRTLNYTLGVEHELYQKFVQNGYLQLPAECKGDQ